MDKKLPTSDEFIEQVKKKLGHNEKLILTKNEDSIRTAVQKFLNTNSKDISSVASTAINNIQKLKLDKLIKLDKSIKRALISKIKQIEKVVSSEQRQKT